MSWRTIWHLLLRTVGRDRVTAIVALQLLAAPLLSVTRRGCRGSHPRRPARPDFARDILPIFRRSCFECHGPKSARSRLAAGSAAGGARSSVRRLCRRCRQAAKSIAARRCRPAMTKSCRPSASRSRRSETELLRRWIDAGAVWPENVDTGQALGVCRLRCDPRCRRSAMRLDEEWHRLVSFWLASTKRD